MESTCVNVQCICGMDSLTIEKHVVMLYICTCMYTKPLVPSCLGIISVCHT